MLTTDCTDRTDGKKKLKLGRRLGLWFDAARTIRIPNLTFPIRVICAIRGKKVYATFFNQPKFT